MPKFYEKQSTASMLAAKKDKSMFPVFTVRNPMPRKKNMEAALELSEKPRITTSKTSSNKGKTRG